MLFFIFGSINLYFHFFYNEQADAVLIRLLGTNGHRQPHPDEKIMIPPAGAGPQNPEISRIPLLPNGAIPPKNDGPDFMDRERAKNGFFFQSVILFPHDKFDLYDYFSLALTETGEKKSVISDYRLRYDDEIYDPIAKESFKSYKQGKFSGMYDGIRWKIKKNDGGYFTACVNMQNAIAMQVWLLRLTVELYAVCILISFFLAMLFSKWAIAPVKVTLAEQKQFIADASHELKTPIAVIGANVDVLISSMPDSKWLQYIKTENERLSLIVKDLLYLAHNDSGRIKLTKTDFNLCEMVESVVLPFESIVYEQGKTLKMEIPEAINIRADETSLKEVVIVLVDNALKNSDKGAVIRVSVCQSAGQRYIKVYNTGKGILSEDLDKIFLRFYRSDTSRTRNTGGSGLGLSIAQSIVHNHGGTIKAASEYGKWAEFTVKLPER
ncbi:MAG: HAMP domain-containing histidine kinase [Treponema sp.]|nr:HAMP domain-containing histidine kinase [Treponema sp.]